MAKQISNIVITIEANGIGDFTSAELTYVANDSVNQELKKVGRIDFALNPGQLSSANALIAAAIADSEANEGI